MVCGILHGMWCVTFGVSFDVACDVWRLALAWHVVCEIWHGMWCVSFGVWHLTWHVVCGIWY